MARITSGPERRPARRVGRPRMAEDPAKRTRNLFWLAMQQLYGLSAAEIANHEKVATRTVQAGIRDALGYVQPGSTGD